MVIDDLVVVDTNILILYVEDRFPNHIAEELEKAGRDNLLVISELTTVEAIGPAGTPADKENKMQVLLTRLIHAEVNPAVIQLARTIRTTMRSLKAADAIIAATALYFDSPLVSTDRHMGQLARAVPEFKLINPVG